MKLLDNHSSGPVAIGKTRSASLTAAPAYGAMKHRLTRSYLWEIFTARTGHPDRIRQIFRLAPISATANALNSLIVAFSAWGHLPSELIIGWVVINLLQSLWFFSNRNRGDTLRITRISSRTIRSQAIFASLIALPWSLAAACVALYLPDTVQLPSFIAFITYSVGGSIVYAVLPSSVASYVFTFFLPSIFINLSHLDLTGVLFAVAFTFISVMMVFFSMYYSILLSENEERERTRVHDLKKLGEANSAMTAMAESDFITGLTNRRAFNDKLERLLICMDPKATVSHALLLVDLDHFKHINDAYGHEIGDLYLIKVAERLTEIASDQFLVARLGGDEFALLSKSPLGHEQMIMLSNRLITRMSAPYDIDTLSLKGGCSIGIAQAPLHSTNGSELLVFADQALRLAKRTKRGSMMVFSATDKEALLLSRLQALALEQAVGANLITAAYQPQIDLNTGRLVGFEALARWSMEGLGPVSPLVFFALAEEHGFVLDLCDSLWRTIGATASLWSAGSHEFGHISVNVHPVQLHHPKRLLDALDTLAIAAGGRDRIMLEITENCIIGRGMEAVPALLSELSHLGYRISLDDFGTGFASLTQIKELPIHELKIDRHFIKDLPSDNQDRAIVRAIYDIAEPRKIKVVAEGVETEEQLRALASLGGSIVQGYYYSKPLPPDEALVFMAGAQGPAKTFPPTPQPRLQITYV